MWVWEPGGVVCVVWGHVNVWRLVACTFEGATQKLSIPIRVKMEIVFGFDAFLRRIRVLFMVTILTESLG